MKTFTLIILLSIVTIQLFGTNNQNEVNDTIAIDEVIITGSKNEISRRLIPVSVTQVSHDAIENAGEINILPAISALVPGVFVTERNVLGFGVANGGAGAISMRGVSSYPNTTVLVLIDGHPQYQGIFGHPLTDAYVTSDVEKVEVIRGPASILYGSNAMAGVVNIITKQQKKDGFKADIEASYGSFNTQKYSGTVGYKKDKLSLFASINHDETDGTRDSTDFKITNGFAKINYQLNTHYKVTADLNMAFYEANDNGSIYKPAPLFIDITRGKTSLSIENKHKNMDGALKLYHNFGTHDISDGWYSTDRNSGAMFYQTIQLFKGNKLTAGLDAKQYGGKSNNGKAKDSLVTVEEFAVYAYMQQSISDKVILSAGGRLENNSKFGNELVPMVGINYNPTPSTTIKSSVSKGFRSPTVMEMYLYAPNEDLEPERMINYELSWIQSYMNNRLQTELTLFTVEGDNKIEVDFPTKKRINKEGSFTNKGVEFAAKYSPCKHLFLNANYSYIDLSQPVLAAPRQIINASANFNYNSYNLSISAQHIDDLYTSVTPEITENYTLINARISAQVNNYIKLYFMANNLLEESYEINYGYPMPKANFTTGIKAMF